MESTILRYTTVGCVYKKTAWESYDWPHSYTHNNTTPNKEHFKSLTFSASTNQQSSHAHRHFRSSFSQPCSYSPQLVHVDTDIQYSLDYTNDFFNDITIATFIKIVTVNYIFVIKYSDIK